MVWLHVSNLFFHVLLQSVNSLALGASETAARL